MSGCAFLLLFCGAVLPAAGTEFFESKIRPVLAEKCYLCHSAQSGKAMGGLRLDDAAALRKGGDSGPAIVPGDPARSLLLEAIRYTRLKLKMPPTGRLSPEQVADFERWIREGAADPRTPAAPAPAASAAGIDWVQARRHWAFSPVRPTAPPAVKAQSWPKTPVDRFVLARLEAAGLEPAPPVDRRSWLRRVSFDLTGLPPTPAALRAYLADTAAEAESRVVEQLLASPQYGERWARHWLDLVRFAETNGHEFDNDKLDAWRYRDYIIRAFQEDVSYQQLIREHLAGDLLRPARLSRDGTFAESPLGTGAFWFGEVLNSATDSVKSRADMVDNQIDVFGKAFLGLTVACARCHDHKFDPLPTADYYALAGVMHSTYVREAVVDSPARVAAIREAHGKVAAINREIAEGIPNSPRQRARFALREGDELFDGFDGASYDGWQVTGEAFGTAPAATIPPNLELAGFGGESVASSFGSGSERLVGSLTSRKFKMPRLYVHVRMKGTAGSRALREREPLRVTVVADDHKSEHLVASGKPGFEWVTVRMTKEIGRTCYFEIVDRSTRGHLVVDAIVVSDHASPPPEAAAAVAAGPARAEDALPPSPRLEELRRQRAAWDARIPESAFAMISMEENPHNVRLHIRGNHENLGPEIPRRFLQVIAGADAKPFSEGSGRRELAEWMSSERNPLTARVMVNRIWKHHFGQGLVRSADNFGRLGEAPSHPELLDWLAARFIESGWSVKEMHRLMTLSATYGMSGTAPAAARQADPQNRLLHHMPVRRLEAEAIRDSMLAVSGRLDPMLYGPSVPPHISPYQDGRGKPESGPLDGKGRRSLYIQVRRNFLTPMFLAFDYPLPVSTTGTRGVSTVPSQALLLLNNEFVQETAEAWARRTLAATVDPAARIDGLYEEAFARPPDDWERREALTFLEQRRASGEERAWATLCHVLLNSAEFLYVR